MSYWNVKNGTATKNKYTTISSNGLLYVGLGQQAGTLIVEGGESSEIIDTATVTVQVSEIVTPGSALLDNSKAGSRQFKMSIRGNTIGGGKWSLFKSTSTEIASDTTIDSDGTLKWTTNQKSGQIQVKWEKEEITKSFNVVFKKQSVTVSPKTATVGNGESKQFTVS